MLLACFAHLARAHYCQVLAVAQTLPAKTTWRVVIAAVILQLCRGAPRFDGRYASGLWTGREEQICAGCQVKAARLMFGATALREQYKGCGQQRVLSTFASRTSARYERNICCRATVYQVWSLCARHAASRSACLISLRIAAAKSVVEHSCLWIAQKDEQGD